MNNKIFHVISNTHWDREWRFPFQRNRQMLVDMIDAVIAILESDPTYRAFHLDSQSIVVRDYLEAKPQMKERFVALVKDGRLLIGPWYILPDEFLVGGENLIRNLLLGHRISAEHGGISKVGYSPFSWGQISQLPQLYKEFGIDLIMFYRGVNSLDSPKAEFLWEGADGTRSVTSRFSTMPRYNFYFYIYRPVVHNEGFSDVEYKWSNGGVPFHFADAQQRDEDYFIIQPLDGYHPGRIEKQVNAIIHDQSDDFTTPHVIWMEGHDSSGPNAKTPRILRDIIAKFPDLKVVHSTLSEYAQGVLSDVDRSSLKLVTGERRSAQYDRRSGNLYGYTTSARMFLKQRNFEAERWVQWYAEPFCMFSGLAGRDINDRYLDMAWELLLQNSAHDSIGGCSLDEIHDDMMHRYKQSIEISKGVFEASVKHLVRSLDMSAFPKKPETTNKELFLVALNANNHTREEVVEAVIDIPKEFDAGGFEIVDKDGNVMPVQLKSDQPVQPVLEQMIDRPMYFDMHRYTAYVQLGDLRPFSMTTFKVLPVPKRDERNASIASVKRGFTVLDNGFLSVRVNHDGTLNVQHEASGAEYTNIASFHSEGEAGHAWVHQPVKPFIDTVGTKPAITIVENGHLSATVRIDHQMKLPADLKERKDGKKSTGSVSIAFFVTLKKDAERLEFSIRVANAAESHRLRIHFPTGLEATYSYGEGQFDVVQRTLERPNTKQWVEQPMYDFPMHHFVDLTDGKRGAAVLVNGLKEYEVLNDRKRTLAVTLFRAFEFIIAPSSRQDYTFQKGSQCLGEQTAELAFYPHTHDWNKGNVYREALNYNVPVRLVQTGRTSGDLPGTVSLLRIDPPQLVFSAFKKEEAGTEDCYILRVYNPTGEVLSGEVTAHFILRHVSIVTLEEKHVEDIPLQYKDSFEITVGPKKIQTIRIQFYQ
jgi:alpha-mannosidase